MPDNFFLSDCIAATDFCSKNQLSGMFEEFPPVTCVVFDLLRLDKQINRTGVEKIIRQYLAPSEQEYWNRLAYVKRKREWLGGRLAAKYAAARLLSSPISADSNWSELTLMYDANGRPFLKPAYPKMMLPLPDISISHSADLAAAMAASRGLCGIDIQKITARVGRVRKRFCTETEEQILASFFAHIPAEHPILLTKLWAAKETVRKAVKPRPAPGFLELELAGITAMPGVNDLICWKFILKRFNSIKKQETTQEQYSIILGQIEDYILALTCTDAIVA